MGATQSCTGTESPPSGGATAKTMRRLVLVAPGSGDMSKAELTVETVPVPTPRSGEVLIKVSAAPINPSDYGEWWTRDEAGADEPPAAAAAGGAEGAAAPPPSPPRGPKPIGKEGSGVVVASGGGMMNSLRVGTKVGFTNLGRGQGSYSEYVTVSAMMGAFALPDVADVADAASFFVNPYTACGIVDTVEKLGGKGLVHTAAASQLGQMLVKLCKTKGVALINVVRRDEQAAALRAIGAEHVVVTGGAGPAADEERRWKRELGALVERLGVFVAFDAIAGETSGALLAALPPKKGVCFVYGGLSAQPVGGIDPMDLIYRRKRLEGWLLPNWLSDGGQARMLMRVRAATAEVNAGLADAAGGWSRSRFIDTPLDEAWPTFLDMYQKNGAGGFTDRKLRIRFD
jgi:NADPH:quinone reductase-like Zn-dependent oxidoreductase